MPFPNSLLIDSNFILWLLTLKNPMAPVSTTYVFLYLCICGFLISLKKKQCFFSLKSINQLIFVMVTYCVFFEVRIEFLSII
jgi:hypothetical protein